MKTDSKGCAEGDAEASEYVGGRRAERFEHV